MLVSNHAHGQAIMQTQCSLKLQSVENTNFHKNAKIFAKEEKLTTLTPTTIMIIRQFNKE